MLKEKPLKEFKIFRKKFTWTRTKIINSIILTAFFICLIIWYFLHREKSLAQTFLLYFSFSLYLTGLSFKLFGFTKIKQLQGNLRGTLIFHKEYIEINRIPIKLDEIKKIEIQGVDWYGLQTSNYLLGYSYENGLSNGIENFVHIDFYNNEKQTIQFQKIYANEFDEIGDIIKHYYVSEKISYLNCIDILCLKNEQKQEMKNLKKTLQLTKNCSKMADGGLC